MKRHWGVRTSRRLSGLLGLALFAVTGAAYAATPATVQYGRPSVNVKPAADSVGGVADTGGTLPFTGMPLALIVAAALALVVVGLFVRRRAARSSA